MGKEKLMQSNCGYSFKINFSPLESGQLKVDIDFIDEENASERFSGVLSHVSKSSAQSIDSNPKNK